VILAIDGASTELSVALADASGTIVAEDAWSSAQRQSAELLPRLIALLGQARVSLGDVSAIAVGTGPGSFTGLRVAMALAKGLSVGLDRPIVGVPSLVAWLDAAPDAAAAVARAGARDAYVVGRASSEPIIVDRDALGSVPGPLVAPAELSESFGLAGTVQPRAAGAIARRAADRLAAAPSGDDLAGLEPIYVQAPRGLRPEVRETVKWL
jgi:tRNA threonylcarbamoyladenosine biosynthesis protein TsaB